MTFEEDIKNLNLTTTELVDIVKELLLHKTKHGFAQPTPDEDEPTPAERDRSLLVSRGTPTDIADDVTGDAMYQTPVLQAVRMWASMNMPTIRQAFKGRDKLPPKSSMAIFGLPGRGKSIAAAWLLLQVQAGEGSKGNFPMWVRASRYVQLRFSKNARDQERAEKALNTPFLVLDDVMRETNGNGELATGMISDLLFERQENKRVTIATFNLADCKSVQHLKGVDALIAAVNERYNAALGSRISGAFTLFEATGPDLRTQPPSCRSAAHHSPPPTKSTSVGRR